MTCGPAIETTAPSDGSVRAEIRRLLFYWPTLVENRTQALHTILTTSNFEWHDGRLRPIFDDEAQERRRPHHRDPRTAFTALADTWLTERVCDRLRHDDAVRRGLTADAFEVRDLSELDVRFWREQAAADAAQVARVRDNIQTLIDTPGSFTHSQVLANARGGHLEHCGWWTQNANIGRIPDDAADDWLDACDEFAHAVLAIDGRSTYANDIHVHGEAGRRADAAQSATHRQVAHAALVRVAQLRALRA